MKYEIRVITRDRIGVVSEIAEVLYNMNLNIVSSRASVRNARDGISKISDFRAVIESDSDSINDHYIEKRLFKIRGVRKVLIG